jgi:hypothetical protein
MFLPLLPPFAKYSRFDSYTNNHNSSCTKHTWVWMAGQSNVTVGGATISVDFNALLYRHKRGDVGARPY